MLLGPNFFGTRVDFEWSYVHTDTISEQWRSLGELENDQFLSTGILCRRIQDESKYLYLVFSISFVLFTFFFIIVVFYFNSQSLLCLQQAGRVGYIFYIFHLSSLSIVLSFGRWLTMTEIL